MNWLRWGANSFYVWERTRKGDWGKLARGRIHQLPSNIVRTSLRYSTLSHVKEWKPASGKEKQGPLSEVISSLAILFAHPLLLHMFTNIGPGHVSMLFWGKTPSLNGCLSQGWMKRGVRPPPNSHPCLLDIRSFRTHGRLLPSCFVPRYSRFVPKLPLVLKNSLLWLFNNISSCKFNISLPLLITVSNSHILTK